MHYCVSRALFALASEQHYFLNRLFGTTFQIAIVALVSEQTFICTSFKAVPVVFVSEQTFICTSLREVRQRFAAAARRLF